MDGDELAGLADLFGGLTRPELADAAAELAFKRGDDVDRDALAEDVDTALDDYYLVAVDHDGETVLAPGPVAFPSPPENAEDLPHILDVDGREIPRDTLADAVRTRLESDAEAVDPGSDRARYLVDVTYDAEAWAPADLGDVRDELVDDA